MQRDPLAYLPCLPKCVAILDRLVTVEDIPTEWTYYQIPSPWLQAKIMRVLQCFPVPEDNTLRLNLLLVRCPPPPSLGALLP